MNDSQKKIPITKLIAKLCPDGVEFKTLGEILTIKNGSDYKSFPAGDIPVYGSGGIIAHTSKIAFDKPSVLIPRKGSIDKLYYVTEPFWNVDTIFYTDINTDVAIPRYVFHCLKKEHLEKLNIAGGVPSLTQTVLNKVKIPIPPTEVQREIVRILDKFSACTTELIELLKKELIARKKQYEYYRNKLLTFSDDVPRVNICEIFEIRNGYTPSKAKSEFWENGTIPWFIMEDIRKNGRVLSDSLQHITPEAVKGKGIFKANSIIMATSATIGEHALITVDHLCNQRFINLKVRDAYNDSVDIKYLFYYAFVIDEWCKKNTSVSSFATVDMAGFRKLEIPLPPLSEQKRIAGILDRFESHYNDLSVSIPAEIAARQKQYEYYRDRLLTFREKNS